LAAKIVGVMTMKACLVGQAPGRGIVLNLSCLGLACLGNDGRGVLPVQLQRRRQGVTQTLERIERARRVGRAAAIAPVNSALSIQKESAPREVVVEIKAAQVDAAHVADAQQHEILGNAGDFWMETSNLLAKPAVVGSVVSVENGEDGLAGAAGFRLARGNVVQPGRA